MGDMQLLACQCHTLQARGGFKSAEGIEWRQFGQHLMSYSWEIRTGLQILCEFNSRSDDNNSFAFIWQTQSNAQQSLPFLSEE